MAHADRVYLADTDIWTVDGTNFVTRLKNAAIDLKIEMKDNRAIVDEGSYPVPGFKSASLEWEEAVEGVSILVPGEVVSFAGSTTGGSSASGTVVISGRRENIGDDGVNRPFTAECRTLTIDGVVYF